LSRTNRGLGLGLGAGGARDLAVDAGVEIPALGPSVARAPGQSPGEVDPNPREVAAAQGPRRRKTIDPAQNPSLVPRKDQNPDPDLPQETRDPSLDLSLDPSLDPRLGTLRPTRDPGPGVQKTKTSDRRSGRSLRWRMVTVWRPGPTPLRPRQLLRRMKKTEDWFE